MSEPHYTPKEIAGMWKMSASQIRRIFQDEPGVLKFGESHRASKRGYITLRIPQSTLDKITTRLSR